MVEMFDRYVGVVPLIQPSCISINSFPDQSSQFLSGVLVSLFPLGDGMLTCHSQQQLIIENLNSLVGRVKDLDLIL